MTYNIMWECNRCGDCCRFVAEKDEWKHSEVSEDKKEYISTVIERKERGCEAFVEGDGAAMCLVQALCG